MTARPPAHRGRAERGSSLLLYPAAVLIVVVLGAIAVDLGLRHLAVRQLDDIAASAAQDAVTAGVDLDAFRRDGTYALDPARVERAVAASVARHRAVGTVAAPTVTVDGDTVTVALEAEVRGVFAPALPGGADAVIRARASASVRRR